MPRNPPLSTHGPLPCALSGPAILAHPLFNKGAAFPLSERQLFELDGLLPSSIHTLPLQVSRAYNQLLLRGDDSLAKNTFLASLRAQNLVLYYKLLETHIEELMGIIYTPTQGDAIMRYSELFRAPEGCFLTITDGREAMERALKGWGVEGDVDYIVVTDSEEILGIGDWGVGGIGICTAKLGLMTLCGGLHPNRTLPVVLDCGTDNETLLNDDLYLGLRQPRVRGERYDEFVHTFIDLKTKLFPSAILHFEDFGLKNARRFLNHYRPKIPCVNDDMQATGCVTTAAVYAYCFLTKTPMKDLRVIVFGAGTAGMGVADMIRDAISTEKSCGVRDISKSENDELENHKLDVATNHIWLVDKPGLLMKSTPDLHTEQKAYSKDEKEWKGVDTTSLHAIVAKVKPHVLIGTSTKAGAFTEEVIREMHKHVSKPAVFPLSNPTRLHEAQPTDILAWTDNQALVATGSPFPPVNGIEISECNNALCFPGIGLGMVLAKASICTDEMLVAATKALAKLSPALADTNDGEGDGKNDTATTNKPLLPGIGKIKQISMEIAAEIVRTAVRQGVARVVDEEEEDVGIWEEAGLLMRWVERQMWKPEYRELVRVDPEGKEAGRAAKGLLGVGRRGSVLGERGDVDLEREKEGEAERGRGREKQFVVWGFE